MNVTGNRVGSVTNSFPHRGRWRSLEYPFDYVDRVEVADPVKPDPTYTFWKHSNDTFPMGSIVYFVYSAGRIKIGYSDSLVRRHSILTSHGPFPPIVLLIIKGTMDTERQFHKRFATDRLHGEWFTLSKKMRDFFRARLCSVGRASLRKAEDEFHAYCMEIVR